MRHEPLRPKGTTKRDYSLVVFPLLPVFVPLAVGLAFAESVFFFSDLAAGALSPSPLEPVDVEEPADFPEGRLSVR